MVPPLAVTPTWSRHQVDDRMGRLGIQLPGVGAVQAGPRAGQTPPRPSACPGRFQSRESPTPGHTAPRRSSLPRPGRRSRRAPECRRCCQQFPGRLRRHVLRLHPADVHLHIVFDAAVGQASTTLRYASWRAVYLPTREMVTWPRGCLARSTIRTQSSSSGLPHFRPSP